METVKSVLCVGGLDPAGRAGLMVDAKAVSAQGLRPLCVPAALTYQSSRRMSGFHPVPSEVLAKQLELLIQDEAPAAVKLGQLGSAENLALLVEVLHQHGLGAKTVVDTPVRSSVGGALFPQDSIATIYAPLLSLAALVTPNAPEALLLSGAGDEEGRLEFGRELSVKASLHAAQKLPARAVLLTGGHVAEEDEICDRLLVEGKPVQHWSSPRLSGHFRGTGCRLASAIAARLALGDGLSEAVSQARLWLHEQLKDELSRSG